MLVEVDGVEVDPVEVAHVVVDRVEVDTAGITTAAIRLAEQAALLRQHRAASSRVPDGLVDRNLRAGAAVVADLVGDVLELVAQDLDLLSTKARAGVLMYDETERAVRDAAVGRAGR